MSESERTAGPATGLGRRPFFALVLVLTLAGLLSDAAPAEGQEEPLSDAVPTAWHEAAGLTPLLTAPPPPSPATICVIDTGVTPTPDLNITARWAYDGGTLDDVRATEDSPGHGTLVAHFAAGAVNGWGGAGAFPHGRISSVRVFPREGGASWREYIAAISRCAKLDPNTKVIVISIGGQTIEPGEAEELAAHIERVRDRYGISVVAAAGNGGGRPDFPGRFAAAFTVAAAAGDGAMCGFTATGPGVDIAAPGCRVAQAGHDGLPWALNGTSFAAPVVAGALAGLRSHFPQLSAVDAEQLLVDTARRAAYPVLDADAAFRRLGIDWIAPADRTGQTGSVSSQAVRVAAAPPSHALHIASRNHGRRRLRLPDVRARLSGRRVVLVAHNRPRAAAFEVRLGGRVILRRSSRIAVRTSRRHAWCRFVTELRASRSTRVRW